MKNSSFKIRDFGSNFLRKSEIKKIPKYHNHKREYNGIKFDSKKEMERYLTLKILADKGIISNLNLQVPFLLIPKNEHFRGAYYRADFTYIDDKGNLIVEDTKGMRTNEYKLKAKLMFHVHKIKIKET